MKKTATSAIILLVALTFSLALLPGAHSEPADVKVVSYSWYMDSGYLMVVGEVQNIGTSVLSTVTLKGTAYASDGSQSTGGSFPVWAKFLNPQQKAPFALTIASETSTDGNWVGKTVTKVELTIDEAATTSRHLYSDLKVIGTTYNVNSEGVYLVNGQIENFGSQTAADVTAVATFYNATGAVVGMGYTEALSSALAPSGKVSFQLNALEENMSTVPESRRIQSYAVIVQVTGPFMQGEAPVASPTTNLGPAPTNSVSNIQNSGQLPQWVYAAVIAIVIIAVVGALLMLRRRKPTKPAKATSKPPTKKHRKHRR